MAKNKLRVMWLLNHSSARKFEVPMLKRIGVEEIFLPKRFPQEASFRSASIDYSEDANLSIEPPELAVLNEADWYVGPGKEAWRIANKYFDVLFFIAHSPSILANVAENFSGAAIWRAYGVDSSLSYELLRQHHSRGLATIEKLGSRFWFGEAYSHLHETESELFKRRAVFLPLGLHDCSTRDDEWNGTDRRIFFVCPDVAFNPYYTKIYDDFKTAFGDLPHAIGGAQPISVPDPSVLGFVTGDQHARHMREFRVMFYHSSEPNHIHYHPFEAIRAGMPLVFMGGGILDRMDGLNQPGRCRDLREARRKITRILDGDQALIRDIRAKQVRILDYMRPEGAVEAWRSGFRRILDDLAQTREARPALRARTRKRIAVFLPIGYRGGTLRGAKLLAQALWEGSRAAGEDVDVVLAHLDEPQLYPDREFHDMHPGVMRRSFRWLVLDPGAARRAMRYAGHVSWEPSLPEYAAPDDGIQQFGDCDLWVVVSDRMSRGFLPLRPYACMVYDYIQRRVPVMTGNSDLAFLDVARFARRVLVTTRFTERDALEYAGVLPSRVVRVPMLAPAFAGREAVQAGEEAGSYFLWTTNAARHKNHHNALLALKIYFEELGGTLQCRVTGVDTGALLKRTAEHLQPAAKLVAESRLLRSRVRWMGELSDGSYRAQLAGAAFLWHPGTIDNGTFSVVEAARFGVPALSSDYPAMREIDAQFGLNLSWMDAEDPRQMAERLKWIEENASLARAALPTKAELAEQEVGRLAPQYWNVLRECL